MEGSPKIAKAVAVVVAKLVERSLPIPEVCGSKKRPGVAHFYKKIAKACDKKIGCSPPTEMLLFK